MGACDFFEEGIGSSASNAFSEAVDNARHEYGHGGYTGTIAEKSSYKKAGSAPTLDKAYELAEEILFDQCRFEDKWGPAGYIEIPGPIDGYEPSWNMYLFFGFAFCQ